MPGYAVNSRPALKSRNFDTMLFFKMGKFYEFFHMDAVTAASECGLRYMSDCLEKGKPAHAGVPEAAFEMRANFLVEKVRLIFFSSSTKH